MLTEYKLNIEAEIDYARKWAYSRNPQYYDFDSLGGDCTNFISQCVFAGGAVMNYTKDTGWFYISLNSRAAAWTGVEFFYNFMVRNQKEGPFGYEVAFSDVHRGDVIQLGDLTGFYHSLLVVDLLDGMPYIAAHTNDTYDRPLFSYNFDRMRILRIDSARREM